jgi:hypothetical protein
LINSFRSTPVEQTTLLLLYLLLLLLPIFWANIRRSTHQPDGNAPLNLDQYKRIDELGLIAVQQTLASPAHGFYLRT